MPGTKVQSTGNSGLESKDGHLLCKNSTGMGLFPCKSHVVVKYTKRSFANRSVSTDRERHLKTLFLGHLASSVGQSLCRQLRS